MIAYIWKAVWTWTELGERTGSLLTPLVTSLDFFVLYCTIETVCMVVKRVGLKFRHDCKPQLPFISSMTWVTYKTILCPQFFNCKGGPGTEDDCED